jgi:SAM-dependent methyltransferase
MGCGNKKQLPESQGVDNYPHDQVDVVADLERRLPFEDHEIDHIFAVHVLEHIHHLIGLMNELHRTLKPSGVLHLMAPAAGCVNAIADPTHVRFFHRQTLKYFCRSVPGLRPYRPGLVARDEATIYADLYPVQPNDPLPSKEELAYFFD